MDEKIEEIVWNLKFNKPKPNLPFVVEEEEVRKSIDQLKSLFTSEVERIIGEEKEVSGCNCDTCRKRDNADVYIRNELRQSMREKLEKLK